MSPHAFERHMAIKNEKSSFFIQNMETCHPSGGTTLNNGNEGCMQNLNITKNAGLTRSEGNEFNAFNECGDDAQRIHKYDAQVGDNARFKRLTKTLLLQLDNCGSKNKNCYVFAYLSLLVAKGVFDMVQLGFLMVGHTHEDIDALFSCFLEETRSTQVFTFSHLM